MTAADVAAPAADAAAPARPRWYVVVGGAVVIAAVSVWFRYRALGVSSLWLDDAWVGVGARFPTIGDTIRSGLTSPGFSLLYRGWAGVFGHDATAGQLLSFLFAIAAPVALFLLALERRQQWYAALLGAGLLASAPAHIEVSVRLKQYSAEAFVATLVLWAAWRVLEHPDSARRWALLAAVALGSGLLSSIGVLTAAAAMGVCFIAALVAKPRRLGPAAIASAAVALPLMVWVVVAVQPNVSQRLTDYWRGYYLDGDGVAGGLAGRIADVARGYQDLPTTLVVLTLLVAATITIVRRPLLGLLLVAPSVVATLLAALTITPLGTGRTDVYLFASFGFLVTVAVSEVAAMLPSARVVVAGVAVVVFLGVLIAASPLTSTSYPQEDINPLVHRVERARGAGDVILVYSSSTYAYGIATKYPIERRVNKLAATNWDVDVRGPDIEMLDAHRDDPEKWAKPLDALAASSPRVWVIGSHLFPDWFALKSMLEQRGYRAKRTEDRAGAQLVLFVKEPSSAAAAP